MVKHIYICQNVKRHSSFTRLASIGFNICTLAQQHSIYRHSA